MSVFTSTFLAQNPRLQAVLGESQFLPGALVYRTPVVVASILASGLLLFWFRTLPFTPTAEESLKKALDQESTVSAV